MKILITGKNSYIGNSFLEWVMKHEPQFEVDKISLRNIDLNQISFKGYDVIYHVAGIAHITSNKKLIPKYFSVNRDLAIAVAKKAKEAGVKQFIFTSSMAIYGDDLPIGFVTPINIDQPKPTNAYGESKLEADLAIQDLNNNFFKTLILRIPMVYGKNAKGNFLKLYSIAKKFPLYPKIKNIRSVLNINNLSEFVRLSIIANISGVYYPQDNQYFSTNDFITKVRQRSNKSTHTLLLFNPVVILLSFFLKLINKIYGNKFYELKYSTYKNIIYQVESLDDFINSSFKTNK
jgi:UDP-glucose 4-epimerase